MSKVGAAYLPIRPAGYKPAPVPYFNELMKAQSMLPIGITALAASADKDDEKPIEEEPKQDDFETKEEWGKAYREWWEKKKKTLPKQDPEGDWVVLDPEGKEDSRWRTEEEAEAERQFWEDDPDDLQGYRVKNVKEKADYSFDLPKNTQEILDELREQFGDEEANALEEKIRLGIGSKTKHAQGGLVGIDHLTRSL
jgi:hypothetical protein|tara:strand:+ start:43 stop:630 length:588 start_codon:yes stop_codon:yes gene_type:complete